MFIFCPLSKYWELNRFATPRTTRTTVPTNRVILAMSCQVGTGPTERRVSITTGDVKGNSVIKVVKVENGDSISWLIDMTVKIRGRVRTNVD